MPRCTTPAERLIFILLFLGMGGIGVLTLSRSWLEAWAPGLYRDGQPPLVGVQLPVQQPTAGLAGALDGSLQRAADSWAASEVPYRSLIVRSFNEAVYRIFAASYMNHRTLVFGRRHTLFEELYIEAYCGLRHETDRAQPDAFALRLRAAQEWFASRGQLLVYAIVPSKTAWFPDRIGSAFRCAQDSRDHNYTTAIRALSAAGVSFVDGRAALMAARGHGIDLFPRNGTHWNQLGAAIFVDAFIDALERDGVRGVPRLRYSVTMTPGESGSDTDLTTLANLLWPPDGAPAPVVQIEPPKIPGTLNLVTVNDSYMILPAWLLASGQVFRQVDFYHYFRMFHRRYPDMAESPVDPSRNADVAPIFAADVILLEEVEARWGGPLAAGFLDLVDRMRATASAR